MKNGHVPDLFQRFAGNPILTVADWPYPANSVFNCGATLLPTGETLLLCRVEDRRGISHLSVAKSANGFTQWSVTSHPSLSPDESPDSDELWGLEDPRIVYIPEMEQYAVTYTGFGVGGPGVKLALTKNFVDWETVGSVMPPEDKDASLFPVRFGDRWAMIHRPVSAMSGTADMWISYSPDLRHWGDHKVMLQARRGAWWDANKIGLSPPPIETKEGWLILYHGVRRTPSGSLYRVGAALFDLDNPGLLVRRGAEWIFGPEEAYERTGDVGDVVFPCGYVIASDADTLRMYYGAADTSIAVATASIQNILDWLKSQKQ